MRFSRRDLFSGLLGAAAASQVPGQLARAAQAHSRADQSKLGIPGLFPGRVVSVRHPGNVIDDKFQADAIQATMRRGMMELAGAPDWVAAWRLFFEPGDVVGIKVNPVGQPDVISSPPVLHEIIAGLNAAGVKNKDIVVYDRYRQQFLKAGFDKWLPEGVRQDWAAQDFMNVQLDMEGYDPDHYMDMPLVLPNLDPHDVHTHRSYVCQFLTKHVNKVVNLPVLKHHQSAGVTLSLKNLSHGSVNNVNRSHPTPTLNVCGEFIPAVVNLPVIRNKVVLNILDGTLGMWHGGPGGRKGKYVWAHQTIYFGTDPVAVDKTGWLAIDEKRLQMGAAPVAYAKPDADSVYLNMQPEHIEIAGALGLGVFDEKKIVR
ncbi:MAG TPA: DUF362 domain-containing protein, partial [Bryobacterales bacterium]|nr:DUF362 domain-containing protein [Bryobacterales bacterium]